MLCFVLLWWLFCSGRYARFRQIKEQKAYLAAIEEAARRKREADTARQNDLRRDFQRRRHLLINKMYRDSAISLLERMMEPRGVNLDLQFRSDGRYHYIHAL